MEVYISEPPAPNPPALLRGRFSSAHGTFALLIGPPEKVRSRQTRKTISIPFFHCLGKNLRTVGAYTGQTSEFRAQIQHWFAAYDAQHLVVFNGAVLGPATMEAVFEYAAPVKTVTFICEPGGYERTRAALQAAGVDTARMDWDELLLRLPVVPQPEPLPASAYGMEHLPPVDFLLFRHRVRTVNTAERFAAIDDDYRAAYSAALTVEPDLDAVVSMLARVTRHATDAAALLVALRAAQVALLTRGWLLGANQDKAIGTLSSIRSPNPTDANWWALHGHVRTPRVAGVALYLLDVPPDDLNTVTVGEVQGFLDDGHVRGRPIPDLARPLLKAHLSARRAENAKDNDPYLNQKGERRHLEDLIDARRHLGIPIDPRNLRGGTFPHAERPIRRFGLELRSLT